MKSFHSKMMLCDVLAEREAQVNLKDELNKLEQIREERFLEMERQNYRKMLERELTEQQQREAIAKVALVTQKQQLAEFKEKQFREIEDSMIEGELLRRKALEDIEEEKKAEGRRRKQAMKAVEETSKANDYLKQIKAEDLLRQAKEEEKIEEYARRKEHMMELRKKKEEEVFAAKQAQRQQIIEKQASRLAALQSDEAERVERQVLEKEIADEKKRLDKEEQLQRWQDDITKSRQQQIARKQEVRDREKTEDRETAQFLGEWCKVLDKQEKEEQLIKKSALTRLASEHKKQVEIQRRRKTEAKRIDDQVAIRAKNAMEADTVEFHGYAEACIREYAEEGKNVIPLIKELREFRKRVLE